MFRFTGASPTSPRIYMRSGHKMLQPIPLGVSFSKAQSSKLKRLFCCVSAKRDVRALSFELWNSIQNVTPSKIGCTWFISIHTHTAHSNVRHDSIPSTYVRCQFLCSQGYLVVKIDNRGSSRRGLVFESPVKWDMGNLEVLIINESRHSYGWVMSHIWLSHVTYTSESCHSFESIPSYWSVLGGDLCLNALQMGYGVASISRLHKNIGLFCRT